MPIMELHYPKKLSLKFKLLFPLFFVGAVLAVVSTSWNYFQFVGNLKAQGLERAVYLANMLVYTAQIQDLSHLQRMIFAVAAESDVDQIFICGGSPFRVLASSNYSFVETPIEDVLDQEALVQIQKVSNSKEKVGVLQKDKSIFSYTVAFSLPDDQNILAKSEDLKAIVYVRLNISGIEQTEGAQGVRDTILAFLVIIGITGMGYVLMRVFVIRPLEYIRGYMDKRKTDSSFEILNPMYEDEIGDLVHSLNAMMRAQEESQVLFEMLAKVAPVLVWIADKNGIPFYFNKAWLNFRGKQLDSEIDDNWMTEVHPEEKDEFEKLYLNAFEKRIGFSFEFRLKDKNKDYRWLVNRAVPIILSQNDFEGFIGVCLDITERKYTEEALKLAKDEALASSKAKSNFLAILSHEIRTPMNGVLGFASLLKKTTLMPNQSEYLEQIETNGRRLLDLINDILDISKIEAGKIELENTVFDPLAVIQEVFALFVPLALDKKLEYTFENEGLPTQLLGEPVRLRQVLINIIGNAIKFTSNGFVKIKIKSHRTNKILNGLMHEGWDISIEVHDSGIGISIDKQEKIFEPFSQGDASTTREYGGTGLGLSIARSLIELMHGSIQLESQENNGTVFYIQFFAEVALKNEALLFS